MLGRQLFWLPWLCSHRVTMPPIPRARVVTEWFVEHENDVNHVPWPSQSPDLNPVELWEILEQGQSQRFPTTINKTTNYWISHGIRVSHPSNRVPDSCIIYAKVHWSCPGSWWPNTLIRHLCWCFLYFGSYVCQSWDTGWINTIKPTWLKATIISILIIKSLYG